MIFYLSLFLIFLYFKIARVHKKEEKFTTIIFLQHSTVAVSTLILYIYGFTHFSPLALLTFSFLFFIISALLITTIQLGIFIDGKPLLGINKVFKFMPLLTITILVSTLFYLMKLI
jgi:hypothetical protein